MRQFGRWTFPVTVSISTQSSDSRADEGRSRDAVVSTTSVFLISTVAGRRRPMTLSQQRESWDVTETRHAPFSGDGLPTLRKVVQAEVQKITAPVRGMHTES